MFMQCRVISRTTQLMRSMTKEEQVKEVSEAMDEEEDMVDVMDISFATTADNKDTSRGTIPTRLQLVSIAGPLIMLLKNVLYYKLNGRKRDHRWVAKMYS